MDCKYFPWNGTHLSCRQPSSSFQVCLVSCHLCFVAEISSSTCHRGYIISILIYLYNCSSYLPLPSIWISGRLSIAPFLQFFCLAVIVHNFIKVSQPRWGMASWYTSPAVGQCCREQQRLRAAGMCPPSPAHTCRNPAGHQLRITEQARLEGSTAGHLLFPSEVINSPLFSKKVIDVLQLMK